jgi:thermitase
LHEIYQDVRKLYGKNRALLGQKHCNLSRKGDKSMRPTRVILIFGMALVVSICTAGDFVYGANIVKQVTLQHDPPPAFAPDQVVVAFKPGTPGEAKRAVHVQTGGQVINTIDALNAELVGIPRGTVLEKIGVYRRNPNVRYAEPNYYYTLDDPPDEGEYSGVCSTHLFDEQWGLYNSGQSFQIDPYTEEPCAIAGVPEADIDWMEVWESAFSGADNIKIAIVDTGIDFDHPDLVSKYIESWVATGILEGPDDLVGHGTHVAGIAAATTNNGIGISGVGIKAKVGSLKACQCYPDPIFCLTGICSEFDIAQALDHASDQGYHVINMSFGGPHTQTMQAAINGALEAGLVLVASAGNAYLHNEPSYPAAYDGVVAVAATDYYDNLASFSNFGNWVEVAAPGVDILSTYPAAGCLGITDCYSYMSGTSMASPVVAGAAALVFASLGGDSIITSPQLRDEVIGAILANADQTGALGQNMLAWTQYGRLNVYAALNGTTSHLPNLSVSAYKIRGTKYADLTWSGATTDVNVYRDGGLLATTVNDGLYTDETLGKGGGSATYKVCEAGTTICSNSVTVSW